MTSVEAVAHRLCVMMTMNGDNDNSVMSYISKNRHRYTCISFQDRIPQLMLVISDVSLFGSTNRLLLQKVQAISLGSINGSCVVRVTPTDTRYMSAVSSFVFLVEILLLIISGNKEEEEEEQEDVELLDGMTPFLQLTRVSNYDVLSRLTRASSSKPSIYNLNLCGFFPPDSTHPRHHSLTPSTTAIVDDDFKIAMCVAQLTLSRHPSSTNVLNLLHLIRLYLESYTLYRHAIIQTGRGQDGIENKLFNGTAATTFSRLQAVTRIDTQEFTTSIVNIQSINNNSPSVSSTAYISGGLYYCSKQDCLSLLSVYGNHAVCSSLTSSACQWFVFVPSVVACNLLVHPTLNSSSISTDSPQIKIAYDVQWKGGQFGTIAGIENSQQFVVAITRETILNVYRETKDNISGFAFALLSWWLPSTIPSNAEYQTIDMKGIDNGDGMIEEINEDEADTMLDDMLEYERQYNRSEQTKLELDCFAMMSMNTKKWRSLVPAHVYTDDHEIYRLIDWCVSFEYFINVLCFVLHGGSPDTKPAKVYRSSTRIKRVLSFLPLFVQEMNVKPEPSKERIIELIVSMYNEVDVADVLNIKGGGGVLAMYVSKFTKRCEMFGSNTSTLVDRSEVPLNSTFVSTPFKWILFMLRLILGGFSSHDYELNRTCLGRRVPFWILDSNKSVCIGQIPKSDTVLNWKQNRFTTTHSNGMMHPIVWSVFKHIKIETETKQALNVLFADSYRTQNTSLLKRSDSIQDNIVIQHNNNNNNSSDAYDPETPSMKSTSNKRARVY